MLTLMPTSFLLSLGVPFALPVVSSIALVRDMYNRKQQKKVLKYR